MKKTILWLIFFLIFCEASAQQEGERSILKHKSEGADVDVSLNAGLNDVPFSKAFQDSLRGINELDKIQKVYSQKMWRSYPDSLNALTGINLPRLAKNPFLKKELSEEELVNAVKDRFFSTKREKSSLKPKADSLVTSPNLNGSGFPNPDFPDHDDITSFKLPEISLQDLRPMRANIVKSAYLKQLDSIRNINLKGQRLQLDEKEASAKAKVYEFKKKTSFRDKTYFEGVLGVSDAGFDNFHFSPAFAYRFTQNLSLGAGPNLQVQVVEKKMLSTFGLKSFVKAEFLHRRIYLQVEDIINANHRAHLSEENKATLSAHNFFVGGGGLLPVTGSFSLNIALLYRVNNNELFNMPSSPWVIRIGISSTKIRD